MYLRDLSVELSDLAELPAGYTAREFHESTHPVVERYLELLPRRRVRLGGAAKVVLCVGPRPPAGIGTERDFVLYPDGVALLWLRDVGLDLDLPLYAQSSQDVQQQLLLAAVEAGLLAIAGRTGEDAAPFEAAAQALRAEPFPLPEIPEDELRRRWGLVSRTKRKGTGGRRGPRPPRGT